MAVLLIGCTMSAVIGVRGQYFVVPAVISGALAAGIFDGLGFLLYFLKTFGSIEDR